MGKGRKQSPARAAKRAALHAGTQAEQEKPAERVLQVVPDPAPEPPAAAEYEEINFLLPPGGMMGGKMIDTKKSVTISGPLNAHLLQFQSVYQKQRYKVQNGTVALWRSLLEERHRMVQEALAEQRRTGVPVEPKMGPIQQAFEAQLDKMDAEKSGDIFSED